MFKTNARILLVDDSKGIRALITSCLKSLGYPNVVEAENGEVAWNLMREQHFDLLIIDILMPIKNGVDLIKDVRAKDQYANVPIIVLSAETERDTVLAAIDAGGDTYILKPTTADVIKKKLAEVYKKRM